MVLWLREFAALEKDLRLVTSTYMEAYNGLWPKFQGFWHLSEHCMHVLFTLT